MNVYNSQKNQQDTTPDSHALSTYVWAPDTPPKAVILALHGYGDHAQSTFHRAASYWKKHELLTIAYDHRGFGYNASFGRWPGPEQLISDMHTMIKRVRTTHPDLPLYIMGHSMGGGIILGGAQTLDVDGVILLAPAAWGGDLMPVFQRMLAWSITSVLPDKRFDGKSVVSIQASDNIPMLKALAQDPHYLQPPSPRELLGLIRLMDAAYVGTPTLTEPTLFVYGAKDEVALPDMMTQVYDRLPEGNKTKLFYPNGWHMLLRDLQAERVWEDVFSWISSQIDRQTK